MFYIVYKTTNIINGKFYIGVHATKNVSDKYLGSGSLLKKAINKYGTDNFVREVLHYCNSKERMFAIERSLVTKKLIKDPNCYNLKLGGEGGFDWINSNRHLLDFSKRNTDTSAASAAHAHRGRERYYSNIKYCKQCNTEIPYEKRTNKFCNRSCAATFNNNNRK